MRVIAGRYKGRKLTAPEGRDIRPTTDKTKEAVFSILTAYTPGARVLDLFSGTGGLGIEALSRGAEICIFCDKSRDALNQIRANLDHCGILVDALSVVLNGVSDDDEPEAAICPGEIERTLPRIAEISEEPFDIILMDPPYGKGLCRKAMEIISEEGLLADEGIIVCEHRREEDLPETVGSFNMMKQRRYGISMLSLYSQEDSE